MLKTAAVVISLLAGAIFLAAAPAPLDEQVKKLDAIMEKCWSKHGLTPAPAVDDAGFFRRLSFRVRGKLPKLGELEAFLADEDPDKRAKLIAKWLDSTDFATLMAMRYADMFRIKSEFPINLWPNAVQCYHRYFYLLTLEDRSWKTVTKELLTSSGSNFRIPPANFFRANADRTPKGLAAGTALALMGFRTATLPADAQERFAAFFSRIRFKSTMEWKEEIVYNDPAPAVLKCATPDGETFTVDTARKDPRQVFADWLTDDGNPFFARAYVNRAWYWMFGSGIANPADDLPLPKGFWQKLLGSEPRPNDPADEKLMAFLEDFFRENGYSTKKLFRLILRSRAWQSGWRPVSGTFAENEKYFAVYPVRRLESELLCDALSSLTGSYERFFSVIPEPFTFIPRGTPSVALADGSMSTGTLDKFGRPSRDSGKLSERNSTPTGAQRLHLMNSGILFRQITQLPGRTFRGNLSWDRQLTIAYYSVLCRAPRKEEHDAARKYFDKLPGNQRWRFWQELYWALVNTTEFSCHH